MPHHLGHHCRTCCNVSLWLSNDEPTYRAALDAKHRHKSLGAATREVLSWLPARTPDGARYSFRSVRAALAGLE